MTAADRTPAPPCTGGDVAALLGAWAVDAGSEAEAEAVLDHISQCSTCAEEARVLRGAARALGARSRPPGELRSRVLARARAARAPAAPAPDFARPYAAQVATLDALLAELSPAEWQREILAEHGWSTQDLVAHLAATDGLLAEFLGLPVNPSFPEANGIDSRTAATIGYYRGRPPETTRAAWRAQSAALCEALAADPSLGRRRIDVGWSLSVKAAIVSRAFETWIHAHDMAKALRRSLPPTLPEHLHPMADQGIRSLPLGLLFSGLRPPGTSARVRLDGPGGGEWLIDLTGDRSARPQEPPDVTLTLEVLEFCFLAGARRDPESVPVEIDGDEPTGRALLVAAQVLTGP
jgi:uncharacterized protein (TIGR03083 family)